MEENTGTTITAKIILYVVRVRNELDFRLVWRNRCCFLHLRKEHLERPGSDSWKRPNFYFRLVNELWFANIEQYSEFALILNCANFVFNFCRVGGFLLSDIPVLQSITVEETSTSVAFTNVMKGNCTMDFFSNIVYSVFSNEKPCEFIFNILNEIDVHQTGYFACFLNRLLSIWPLASLFLWFFCFVLSESPDNHPSPEYYSSNS